MRRLLSLVLSVFLAAILAAPVYAVTPQQRVIISGKKAPLFQATNRGAIYQAITAAANANSLRRETRVQFTLGNADYSELRLVFTGFFVASNTDVETSPGNDISLQSAIELVSPVTTVQVTFNGSTSPVTLSNGTTVLISDPIYPSAFGISKFPANSKFWYRGLQSVSLGQFYLGAFNCNSTGEADKLSDGTSGSQLLATGAMTTPTGGSSASSVAYPNLIIGRAIGKPDIAIVGVGDSIMTGFQDNGSGSVPNSVGWFPRGLQSVNGRTPPHARIAALGTAAHTFVAQAIKRLPLFAYFTHGVVAHGINDKNVLGRTAVQAQADLLTEDSMIRARGVRYILQTLITSKTTTSNAWIDTAGQTVVSGYEIGGAYRDPLNALIIASVGAGGANATFNVGATLNDSVATDKFAAPAGVAWTIDGLHPIAVSYTAIGASFNTIVQGFF